MRDPACRHRLCPGEWIDRGDGTLITCPCGCHDSEAREAAALDRLEREREEDTCRP